MPCCTMGTPTRSAHNCSCSTAAARKVSAAPSMTVFPACLYWYASLAMVVVLPTPFTPTTRTTYGLWGRGESKSSGNCPSCLRRSVAISARRMELSSLVLIYLSRLMRSCSLSMILRVVSTPTSEVMSVSSRLSRTLSSTVDLPRMVFDSLEKKLSLVLLRPWSRVSFFSFLLNSPMMNVVIGEWIGYRPSLLFIVGRISLSNICWYFSKA